MTQVENPSRRTTLPDTGWDAPLEMLVADVSAGRRNPLAWTRHCQRVIATLDGDLHAWVTLSERAESDAAARDAQPGPPGPMHGVPLGVKDIIDVAGLPTRCGSTITPTDPALVSAACVQALERLGAVPQGKTVTTEYAYFRPGPTRNPAAPGRTPGGSSSGSAAAVAAGMVPVALGSQTAGSVTRPAAYCGAAAMVLAHGATDLSGIVGLSHSLDALGVLARRVSDLAYVHAAWFGTGPRGLPRRVLTWQGSGLGELDAAMVQAVQIGVGAFEEHGLEVAPLVWDDHIGTLAEDHALIMAYEAVRERPEVVARIDEVSAPLADLLRTGGKVSVEDYRHACFRVERSRLDLDDLIGDDAVILGPAALGPAPEGLDSTGSPVLSRPWQALGRPVVTVPGVMTAAGLPLGLQIVGRPGAEDRLLAAAQLLEQRVQLTHTLV